MKVIEFSKPASPRLDPWVIALAIASGFMLGCMLFYPMGYDQAVFGVGGEMILKHHAIPYRDFLDTKPPIIFYIYASAIGIFGHHDWAIRTFDIVFQLSCSFYFYRILRRSFDANFALASVSIAMMVYAGSGFWHTAQAESFALLPSLVLLDMVSRVGSASRKTILFGLCAGAATMALFLLKFTFVFGAVGAIAYLFLRRDISNRARFTFIGGMVSSSFLLSFGFGIALESASALMPFLDAMGWTLHYAGITASATGVSLLEQLFLLFPEHLIYSTSITVFALGMWGMWLWVRGRMTTLTQPILGLLATTWFFQLVGILVERKISFDYQYARAAWAFVPFAVVGMQGFKGVQLSKGLLRLGVAALVMLALVGSPLLRIFTQSAQWTMIALRQQNAGAEVHRRIGDYYADEQRAVGEYLKGCMSESDKLFFWGNDVAVYWYAGRLPQTICLTATPLRTAWTPQSWRDRMMSQLIAAKPEYFVTEFGDAKEYITGSSKDSYEAMMHWPQLGSYFTSNFVRDTVIGHYILSRIVRSER